MVEFSPATRETGVRFPANANFKYQTSNCRLEVRMKEKFKLMEQRLKTCDKQREICNKFSVPKPGIEPGTFRSSV